MAYCASAELNLLCCQFIKNSSFESVACFVIGMTLEDFIALGLEAMQGISGELGL